MRILHAAVFAILFSLLFAAQPILAQWSAAPGDTARNAFGPSAAGKANQCRGACGSGCPGSCEKTVSFACQGDAGLQRIESFSCGTHQGCRVHDDCLDACLQNASDQGACQQQCDTQIMEQFGFENSASWLMGKGPYDGQINFEYTRDAPSAPEPAYRCPAGATRQCGGNAQCINADGKAVDPLFDSYPTAAGSMRVSNFSAGAVCGDEVCQQTATIEMMSPMTIFRLVVLWALERARQEQ